MTYQWYFPLNRLDFRKLGHTAVHPNPPALGTLPAPPLLNGLVAPQGNKGRTELGAVITRKEKGRDC